MLTESLERTEQEMIEPSRQFPVRAATGLADLAGCRLLVGEESLPPADELISEVATELLGRDLSEALARKMNRHLRELQSDPGNPSLLNNVGVAFLNQGAREKAIEYFARASTIEPGFLPARANLVKAWVTAGDLDRARVEGEELAGQVGDSPLVLSTLASVYSALRDHERAISLHTAILKIHRDDYTALYNRGVQFLLVKRFPQAIADFRKALSIEPKMAAAYNAMGVCFLLQGSTRKAIRNLEISVNLDPAPDSTHNLASVLLLTRQYERVVEIVEPYLARLPDDKEASDLLARAYRALGRQRDSARLLARLVTEAEKEGSSDLPRLCNNLGVALLESGDLDEGIHYLETSLNLSEDEPAPFHNLARVFLARRQLRKAREAYEKYRCRFPDAFTLAFGARLAELEEDYSRAKELYRQSIETEPGSRYGYPGLGMILGDVEGNYEQAVEVFKEGLKHCEGDLLLQNNMAYAHLMLNQTGEARDILDAIKDDDTAFYLWATRGLLLIKEGNVAEGTHLYNRAEQVAGDPEARKLVQQKKRIELGRYWLDRGNTRKAYDLVTSAVQIRTVSKMFRPQAERLLRLIEARADGDQCR